MDLITKLINSVSRCLVPKLRKYYDESIEHAEFDLRNRNLNTNFQLLSKNLGDITNDNLENHPEAIACIVNLYKELSCDTPWNSSHPKDVSKQLNILFEHITNINLDFVFHKNDVFDTQVVFDKCLEELHSKLTYDNFKMYPAQIEVYYCIIKDLKEYNVHLVPSKIFPITLLLIDDYISCNKKKGLQCCSYLLQSLKTEHFENGNYYEVIYRSLEKNLHEKDLDILKLTHSNLLDLFKILPDMGKNEKLDELYTSSLDQLSTESNLYKKAEILNFTSSIIQWHKDNCADRSIFKHIVCHNLDICTNDEVIRIILNPLLKCLEQWIVYCWPVWRFSSDHKMLSALLKVLYVCDEDYLLQQIHKIIVTLICLCATNEQKKITDNLDRVQEIKCNNSFTTKIKNIKADINV